MTSSGQSPARSRRSGDQVRALLLAGARAVFAELGYAGATTKEISARAEVGEVLLFRHFGNKAGLFDEAVLGPFETFVDEWVDRWTQRRLGGGGAEDLAHEYVELLYGFLDDNRQLVVALLSAQAHHSSAAERLQVLFDRLAETIREAASVYGLPVRNPALTVRLTFGMVLSTVEHAELLFVDAAKPARRALVDELTLYVLHGVGEEPESGWR
ncbi:TetR/AcrR family transcriptional regulator [Mycolicibacterium sp. XJ1819]